MKALYSAFFALSLLFVLDGCQTTTYTTARYEQLCPAYYTLPSFVDSVLVVDCSQFIPDNEASKHLSALVCAYLSSELNQSNYIYAALCRQRMDFDELRLKADSLCNSYGKKAIVALRRFSYSHSTSSTERLHGEYLSVRRDIATEATFAIIMPNGSARDFEQRHDTLTSSCLVESIEEAEQQLPTLKTLCPEAAENLAQSFARQLVPAWERVSRPIFILQRPKEFADAARWIQNDGWDNARDLWLQAYSQGSAEQKAIAAYNLAVYFERAGNIEMALIWCSKSLDHFDDATLKDKNMDVEKSNTQNLFKILVQRADDVYFLDKQMSAE